MTQAKLQSNVFINQNTALIEKAVRKEDRATLRLYLSEIQAWDDLDAKSKTIWFLLSEILIDCELTRFSEGDSDGEYLRDVLHDRHFDNPSKRYSLNELIEDFESEENAWYYLADLEEIEGGYIDNFLTSLSTLPEPDFIEYAHDPSHRTLISDGQSIRHCLTLSVEDIIGYLTDNSTKPRSPEDIQLLANVLFDKIAENLENHINEEVFCDVLGIAIDTAMDDFIEKSH